MTFEELIPGAHFFRADSGSSSRKLFVKIAIIVYARSDGKDPQNAVDIATGQLRSFEPDSLVLNVIK